VDLDRKHFETFLENVFNALPASDDGRLFQSIDSRFADADPRRHRPRTREQPCDAFTAGARVFVP
jgi:hypothetical protein